MTVQHLVEVGDSRPDLLESTESEDLQEKNLLHPQGQNYRWLSRREKRYKILFGFGRQEKVSLSQTLCFVRPDFELALPIGQVEIGVMALGLRDSPNLIRKRQSLREILEGVAPAPNALAR